MPITEPQTIDEIDAEILALSNRKDELVARSLELHRRRDELTRAEHLDGLVAGLSDEDKAALLDRLAAS